MTTTIAPEPAPVDASALLARERALIRRLEMPLLAEELALDLEEAREDGDRDTVAEIAALLERWVPPAPEELEATRAELAAVQAELAQLPHRVAADQALADQRDAGETAAALTAIGEQLAEAEPDHPDVEVLDELAKVHRLRSEWARVRNRLCRPARRPMPRRGSDPAPPIPRRSERAHRSPAAPAPRSTSRPDPAEPPGGPEPDDDAQRPPGCPVCGARDHLARPRPGAVDPRCAAVLGRNALHRIRRDS